MMESLRQDFRYAIRMLAKSSAAVIAVLCTTSILAAYVPAKRAATVDPIMSLRAE